MKSPQKLSKPPYLWAVLTNRCPRCREGKLYVNRNPYVLKETVKMYETCPVCGQPTDIEVGFYYGTGFVSYGLAVLYSAITFGLWWLLLGFSLYDNSIFYWLAFNGLSLVILQPWFMRISRTLWLSWFVKYDPDWRKNGQVHYERVIREQMNNW